MKLKSNFVTQNLADAHILAPVGKAVRIFHGFVRANETAGFILECLKDDTTEEEIIDKMMKEYDVDRERAAAGIQKVVAQLKEIDALED